MSQLLKFADIICEQSLIVMVVYFVVAVVLQWLVVVLFVIVILRVLGLVVDFREFMLSSPPELALCPFLFFTLKQIQINKRYELP